MSRVLPLGANVDHAQTGTIVRFSVRAEDVRIEKQTVIAERVTIRKTRERGTEPVRETVRREVLVVNTGGDVERTQRLDITRALGQPAPGTERPPRPAPVPWAQKLD